MVFSFTGYSSAGESQFPGTGAAATLIGSTRKPTCEMKLGYNAKLSALQGLSRR
jgi:hypothetical protein